MKKIVDGFVGVVVQAHHWCVLAVIAQASWLGVLLLKVSKFLDPQSLVRDRLFYDYKERLITRTLHAAVLVVITVWTGVVGGALGWFLASVGLFYKDFPWLLIPLLLIGLWFGNVMKTTLTHIDATAKEYTGGGS